MPNTSTRCSTPKLDAIGYGFLIPVFFVTSGLTFNLSVLFSSASTLLRVPLFLLALVVVRGLPAVLYRSALASIRDVAAAGLLQATSLPFIVAATTIGLQLHAISPANAAALVAAGLFSVILSPSSHCSCCDRLLKARAWSPSRTRLPADMSADQGAHGGYTTQRCGQHAS
jgi:Kef-type K+ transport system membrane component KefB